MSWLSKLFAARDRRRAQRHLSPPIMAFYWDGGVSSPHEVPDISNTGIYVKTEDRWTPSTLLRVTLQRTSEETQESEETLMVQCRVVRTGTDGVGMAIMLAEEDQSDFPAALETMATRRQLTKFLERLLAEATGNPIPEAPYLPFPEAEQAPGPANSSNQTVEQDPKEDK